MDKYSSCCGVQMNSEYADRLICPECKEHCSVEEEKDEGYGSWKDYQESEGLL